MTQDASKPEGDLKPFKIGDMQRPGGSTPIRPPEVGGGESGSGFAFIEGMFDKNDFQGVIGMYDTAMEKLKPLALESPDVEKKRNAHRTIKAYDRAMQLLTRMLQIRQEMGDAAG
jgi:hypothetical protein